MTNNREENGSIKIGFNPDNDGFIQELLRSKIYKYPVLACVREVLTNAVDASALVGKSVDTIEIHLPTRIENYFSIRDHGVGMSEEVFIKNFASYGNSTSKDNDSLVGFYGLGSKAPATINSNYRVTTCWEGVKRTFLCFIDNKGRNSVIKTTETPTLEQGTEILIEDVKESQIEEMASHYWRIVSLWSTKPKCNIKFEERIKEVDNELFMIVRNKVGVLPTLGIDPSKFNSSYHESIVFLMGGVPYTLEKNDQNELVQNSNNKLLIQKALNFIYNSYNNECALIIKNDNKEISITPQRESVYIDDCKDVVENKLYQSIIKLKDYYIDRLEKAVYIKEAFDSAFILYNHFLVDKGTLSYKGITIPSSYKISITRDFELIECRVIKNNKGKIRTKKDSPWYLSGQFNLSSDTKLLVNNVYKGTIKNLTKILTSLNFESCILFNTPLISKEEIRKLAPVLNEEFFPHKSLVFLSDIVSPSRAESINNVKSIPCILFENKTVKNRRIKENEPQVYFLIRPKYVYTVSTYLSGEDSELLSKFLSVPVYGIKEENKQAARDNNWIHWSVAAVNLIKDNKLIIEKYADDFSSIYTQYTSQQLIDCITSMAIKAREGECCIINDNWNVLKKVNELEPSLASDVNLIKLTNAITLIEDIESFYNLNPIKTIGLERKEGISLHKIRQFIYTEINNIVAQSELLNAICHPFYPGSLDIITNRIIQLTKSDEKQYD